MKLLATATLIHGAVNIIVSVGKDDPVGAAWSVIQSLLSIGVLIYPVIANANQLLDPQSTFNTIGINPNDPNIIDL